MHKKSEIKQILILLFALVLFSASVILTSCGRRSVKPGTFSFSGGSGKINITCDEVEIQGHEVNAHIVFSSPYYSYVKVNGVEYEGSHTEDSSSFMIPAVLDEEFKILGCTTAMSRPHEIEYTLYISLDENEKAGADLSGASGNSDRNEEETKVFRSSGDSIVKRGFSDADAPRLKGLRFNKGLDLKYAECFDVFYYDRGYKVISVADGSSYLIVPEGETPSRELMESLPEAMTMIDRTENIYLAASGAMSMFDALGSLNRVRYTGTDREGWDIEAPKEALEDGSMVYAGKYRAPDFEMLLDGGCSLAIESTMILHTPEIKEQLINIGIPVFTDYSSYEKTAAGKGEWIYAYAAMLGKEDRADQVFDETKRAMSEYEGYEKSGKKVALFYISNAGLAVIRGNDDYITDIIIRGGGENAFSGMDLGGSDNAGTSLSIEDLYNMASDADYLIYNATIDASVRSISDLEAKSGLIADFKAVKEDHVFLLDKKFYQSTVSMYKLSGDVNRMLSGEESGMEFLSKMS